jgi:hypothetical protein
MKAIKWCITHSQHAILVGKKLPKTNCTNLHPNPIDTSRKLYRLNQLAHYEDFVILLHLSVQMLEECHGCILLYLFQFVSHPTVRGRVMCAVEGT